MKSKLKFLISILTSLLLFFGCSNGNGGGSEISGVDSCKTLNEFTITFNTRGGSTIEDMKVEKGTYVFAEDPFYELDDDLTEFTLPEPTKEGASFVGWIDLSGKAVFSMSSVDAECRVYHEGGISGHSGPVSYYAGLVFYDSDTLELTAIWKSENPGTFIYANGGKYSNGKDVLIVEEDMEYDSDWTKIEEPVKEGYLVKDYFFENIFSGVTGPFSSSNICFSEDFKYYDDDSLGLQGFDNFYSISWDLKNTVSFETNGGSVIESVDFASNYNLLNSGIPTKDGYIFAGWFIDEELTTVVECNSEWNGLENKNIYGRYVYNTCTVYAKWVPSSYSVTKDNAVSVIQSFYKEFDSYFENKTPFSNENKYLQALDEDVNITIKGLLNEETLSNVAKSISGKLLEFTEDDETTGESKKNYKPFVRVNLDISQVEGLTKIPDYCFSYESNSSLVSIKIAEGVSEIGDYAFKDCKVLTNVTIPASVKTIGDSTFSGCASLKEITLPEGVAILGSSVFSNCSSLTFVVLPSSIVEIGSSSFENCTSLHKIELPKYLTEVSDKMFFGCTALSNVKLGDDITKIGSSVFSNCSSLATIILPSKVDTIGSSAFSNCVKLSNIDIPANVKEISYSTFSGCTSLVKINLPTSILSIGESAFSECSSLTSIDLGNNLKSIGSKAFYNCVLIKEITLPETMETLGEETFNSCSMLQTINIPGSVKTLPNHLFQNCIMLKSVTLSSGTEVISDRTFYDCKSLESITLPDTITHILQCAFYGCSKLSAITIPSSCKKIGDSVFVNCSALKSVAFASKDNWFITDNPNFVNGEVVDVSNDSTNANSFTGKNAKKFWYVSE